MRNKLTFTVIITGLILAYFGVETGVLWSKSPHHKHSLKSCYVKVIDGDTISLDGSKIRLQGIDAPESRQLQVQR